jgi:hypothetical protein
MDQDDRLSFAGDEHWGKGGRYVLVDGKRVPAESLDTAPPEPPAAIAPPAADSPKKPTRRKRGQ